MDQQVADTVSGILADVERRGDEAVRELAVKFDKLDRNSYLLSRSEIESCIEELSPENLSDIEFAQAQVRNFAQHHRGGLRDLEIETLPGVILGHKNIPVGSAGCYLPGGKYPLLAAAQNVDHYSESCWRKARSYLRTSVSGQARKRHCGCTALCRS